MGKTLTLAAFVAGRVSFLSVEFILRPLLHLQESSRGYQSQVRGGTFTPSVSLYQNLPGKWRFCHWL